jgi:CheY-like chemotaxis protein
MTLNKVLVIEDEQIDRYIEEQVIKRLYPSIEIVSIPTAKNALTYLKSVAHTPGELPDVIFIDLYMPLMSGFDLIEEFNDLGEVIKSHCRVYVVSSSIKPEDRILVQQYSFVKGFLSKPFTEKTLQEVLHPQQTA